MNLTEYNSIREFTYQQLCNHLIEKYGPVPGDYFKKKDDGSLTPNPKIKRGKEGLQCHHIKEVIVPSLCQKEVAEVNPFEYQLAENLCYCNLLEHLFLHVLITEEYCMAGLGESNVMVGMGGVRLIATHINTLFNHTRLSTEENATEREKGAQYDIDGVITNNKDVYFKIANRFCTSAFIRQKTDATPEKLSELYFMHCYDTGAAGTGIEVEVDREARDTKLFEWNINCYAQLEAYLRHSRTALVQICTGGGKTTTALEYLRVHDEYAIVLGPKDVIKGAWQPTANEDDEKVDEITKLNAKWTNDHAEYYNYSTFMNQYRKLIEEVQAEHPNCHTIICDEAHHMTETAERWKEGVDYALANTNMKIIGLTATPDRSQTSGTDDIFYGRICNGLDLAEGIRNGDIHPFGYVQSLYSVKLATDMLAKDGTVYSNELISRLNLWLNRNPIDQILHKHMPSGIRKIIVFVSKIEGKDDDCTEAMAIECMKKFDPKFGDSEYLRAIDSHKNAKDNERAIDWFNTTKDHDVCLVNVGMVSEGAHYEGINTLIMFRRTDSSTLYLQQLGRIVVTRRNENPHGIVFDFTNNATHIIGLKYRDMLEQTPAEKEIQDAIKEAAEKAQNKELIYEDYTSECSAILHALNAHRKGDECITKFANPLLDLMSDEDLKFFMDLKSDTNDTEKKKKERAKEVFEGMTPVAMVPTDEDLSDAKPVEPKSANKKRASKREKVWKTIQLIFKRMRNYKAVERRGNSLTITDEAKLAKIIVEAGFSDACITKIKEMIADKTNAALIDRIMNDIPPTVNITVDK